MSYELVLGLEIHMQLGTPTKMFCSCKNDPFYSDVNTNVCPVCLGLPGALPVPNQSAIQSAQKMALALGSKLQDSITFERKNYFYPDIPKGYQITCPHYPIGVGGEFKFSSMGEEHRVRWREIHLEEDTAKSMHKNGKTWIDFNKSGVPLLEAVTEPDFTSIEEAVAFCKEMQLVARAMGASNADMEKGQMRLEANISVREKGSKDLPDYRVEIKNINSFSFMRKALEFELRRQSEALENGETLTQETRGFDENRGKTFSQRSKEEAHDYRYFPEPDIPPIEFDSGWMDNITTSGIELPNDTRKKLSGKELNGEYVEILVQNPELLSKYEHLVALGYSSKDSARFIITVSEYKNKTVEEIDAFEKSKKENKVSDDLEIEKVVREVLSENEKAVKDYKNGNENSLQFLFGQIMKKTQGKVDVAKARKILLDVI